MDSLVALLRLKIKDLETQNKNLRFHISCLKIDNDKLNRLLKQYQKCIPQQIQQDLF